MWRRSGLTVSAIDSGSIDLGSSPGWRHCVVLLGKTLNSHCALLCPYSVPANLRLGDKPAME